LERREMDINAIINLITTNKEVLFSVAVLIATLTLTQAIKIWDKKNKYAEWYGIFGIVIGGVIGGIGGIFIPVIGLWGLAYGIIITYIYSHLPAGFLAKIGLANNADIAPIIPSKMD